MTTFVAVEGADGAGKATAAAGVRDGLERAGFTAEVISFPRYSQTVGGVALGQFLAGSLPVSVTPKAAAVLYGLDRLESASFIAHTAAKNDVIVFDRYIASNMVYQGSKVPGDEALDFMNWIFQLETATFGVPPADLSIYLDTPLEVARELMLSKSPRSYTDRQYDEHEADVALQGAVRRNYDLIATMGLAGPWRKVRTAGATGLRGPAEIADEIVNHVLEHLDGRSDRSRGRMASRA